MSRSVAPFDPALQPAPPGLSWPWMAFLALLVANIPLMLCMPLAADAVLYDLQARTALTGGVLYRDIVEPNLPGIVWCHMAIRLLMGWSEFALKWVDLVIVGGIVALLLRLVAVVHGRRTVAVDCVLAAAAMVMCGFYFSTPEWVHCQRDIWLMLPAMLALTLRIARLQLDRGDETPLNLMLPGLIEGLLWAMAFWIKPFVAVPALSAVAITMLLARRTLIRPGRWVACDVAGLLAGGLLIGAAGSLWLIATGAWPHFWEMALRWNPMYFANGRERWTLAQYLSLSSDLAPWCLVHCVAVPVALRTLWQTIQSARTSPAEAQAPSLLIRPLLAAVYLGWMCQAHFLQHPFHYCHTPTVILAMALLAASWPMELRARRTANIAFAGCMAITVMQAPCFDPQRLSWWPDCLLRGAQPDVKCALHHRNLPNWVELQPVIDYLRQQDLQNGELTAYNVFLVHLYPEVGVMPSTRYVFLDVLMQVFHDRADLIHDALAQSKQKFVVCSLLENGMSPSDIGAQSGGDSPELPAAFPESHRGEFPYCLELVFRSGQYLVYRVNGPPGTLNTQPRPLARAADPALK